MYRSTFRCNNFKHLYSESSSNRFKDTWTIAIQFEWMSQYLEKEVALLHWTLKIVKISFLEFGFVTFLIKIIL